MISRPRWPGSTEQSEGGSLAEYQSIYSINVEPKRTCSRTMQRVAFMPHTTHVHFEPYSVAATAGLFFWGGVQVLAVSRMIVAGP